MAEVENKNLPLEKSEIYEFAGFRLDAGEHTLDRADTCERIALPGKAFDTLCVLVRNAGRLVQKEELLNQVWAGSFVEENNLNKSIHAIRRALGEQNGDQKFIETVKKHGFRFVAEVHRAEPIERATHDVPLTNHLPFSTVREFPRAVASREQHAAVAIAEAVRPEPTLHLVEGPPSESADTPVLPADTKPRRAVMVTAFLIVFAVAGAAIYRYAGAAPIGSAGIQTLAVLPLKPMDSGDNYLGLGVADAIIRRISQTGTVIVRPTSAVRKYLNEDTDALTAARSLGVDSVLEGTLQRAGGRLRVSVNLLRVSDGKSLWTDNFDMAESDAFAIQDSVGQQVASRLQLRLDPVQRQRFATGYTPDAIAYEYYLRGVYSFDQRWFNIESKPQHEATIGLFTKSIEADPNFAPAHAQLAYAYAWMAVYIDGGSQAEWAQRAKDEIARADALDPQLAETHVARHHLLLSAQEGYQLEAAVRELLIARQIDPNIGDADLAADFIHLGLEDLFEIEKQRALEIDPTSEYNKNIFGVLYMNARRYDDWLAYSQKYLDGKPVVQYLLGKGRLDEAQQQIDQGQAKGVDIDEHNFKALLTALRGDHRAAEAEIPSLIREYPYKNRRHHHLTYNIACIYALGGKSTEAVKWLRETAATGFPSYALFERDHFLDRIRQSPEFVQFMAEMKEQHVRLSREFGANRT